MGRVVLQVYILNIDQRFSIYNFKYIYVCNINSMDKWIFPSYCLLLIIRQFKWFKNKYLLLLFKIVDISIILHQVVSSQI